MQWIHSAVHLKIQKQTEFGMGNSKIIRIKIHYVLEAIAAFKVIFHFCLLAQIHTHTHSHSQWPSCFGSKLLAENYSNTFPCFQRMLSEMYSLPEEVKRTDKRCPHRWIINFFSPSTRPFTRFALAVGIVLNHFSVPKLLQHSVCLSRLNILHWKVYYLLSSF